jgi:hypothetical protein
VPQGCSGVGGLGTARWESWGGIEQHRRQETKGVVATGSRRWRERIGRLVRDVEGGAHVVEGLEESTHQRHQIPSIVQSCAIQCEIRARNVWVGRDMSTFPW